ncbi:thermonuclease family protein [Brucella sp. NBRC 14130]|uniref:thermonuclease family protein n=1 Tax=Brucella sp. NBRC 14130 TaxID=3075483 RepID=UPI003342B279
MTCVVDGDTFWKDGVKYRLLDIDAPESSYDKARCGNERERAAEATQLLQRLLRSGIASMRLHGQDRYGRNLVTIDTSLGNVSTVLLNAELAVPFGDKRLTQRWCRLGRQ